MRIINHQKMRRFIHLLVVSLIIAGIIIIPLHKFIYIKTGDKAIIIVIGEPLMETIGWPYDANQIIELEKQYGELWEDLSMTLAKKWDWDIYFFYRSKFNLKRYKYETLFVLFEGHQTNEDHPTLTITDNWRIKIESIAEKITCNNLTVLVQACYSLKWTEIFIHEKINSIYTSDLENKISKVIHMIQGGTVWNKTINLHRIESYSYFFISQLINGANYEQANITATMLAYQNNLTGSD